LSGSCQLLMLWTAPTLRQMLCAFDLLELDGEDLRPEPIEKRKDLLAELLRGSHSSIAFNEHFEEDGAIVFREACKLGCEGLLALPQEIRRRARYLAGSKRRRMRLGAA